MKKQLSAREIAYIGLGAALIAVCAWISIPLPQPMVPFTLQTFAVCLVCAVFGRKLGLWTVVVYILLGAVGVPVFSGFRGGVGVLLGTTGGYIIGFVFRPAYYSDSANKNAIQLIIEKNRHGSSNVTARLEYNEHTQRICDRYVSANWKLSKDNRYGD